MPEAPSSRVKTRFAPSPTGRLHLGNARTALFNALLARGAGGVFLLRIEDTDRERSRPEYVDALVEDLRWLGLEWQEGYGAGGDAGPYRQSERAPVYRELLERLVREGRAYPCFCSPQRLGAAREAQRARGEPPRYDGACAGLAPSEATARLARGEAAALRFRVAPGGVVTFEDAVRGTQRFETDGIGDFVIRRADGTPAFFFCNAVDDALMGVTDVLRAEDHLSNTPRQLLLLDALGLPAPRYAHVSLLVDDAGAPLSKREGSLSLAALREAGYLPLALCNYLARLGHHYREADCLGLDALAAGFDGRSLGAAPARFDAGQLLHWQGAALALEPPEGIWAWMGEATRRWVPEGRGEAFIRAVRGNVRLPAEAEAWARRLFDTDLDMDAQAEAVLARAGAAFLDAALASLAESGSDFRAFAARLGALTGLTGRGLFGPLRAALTGRLAGPELGHVYALLGPEGVRQRLRQARGRRSTAGPGGHENG